MCIRKMKNRTTPKAVAAVAEVAETKAETKAAAVAVAAETKAVADTHMVVVSVNFWPTQPPWI